MANIQYIGARYVTKIYENSLDPSTAEWEAGVFYEPLVLVTYQYGSYLSKKEVPSTVGDPAANPQYWVQTGFYNGQIANLQDQINDLHDLIDKLNDGIVTPEMYGAAGDGVTDDTAAINSMLADCTHKIALFTKEYLVDGAVTSLLDDGGLQVHSNTTIAFVGGSVIKEKANNASYSHIFNLLDVENVEIYGGTLIGDYDIHTDSGQPGNDQWCHGIRVSAGKNIHIHDMIIKNCYADGIYVGQAYPAEVSEEPADNHSRNVFIENVTVDKAGRNGITIGECTGWHLDNINVYNVTRTDPKAAIDIEREGQTSPVVVGGSVSNIYSDDCIWGVKVTNLNQGSLSLDNIVGNRTYIETNAPAKILLNNIDSELTVGYTEVFVSNSNIRGFNGSYGNYYTHFDNCDIIFDEDCNVPAEVRNSRIKGATLFKQTLHMSDCFLSLNANDTYYIKVKLLAFIDSCFFDDVPATCEHLIIDDSGTRYAQLFVTNCKSAALTSSIATAMVDTAYAKVVDGNNYFPFASAATTAPVSGCTNFEFNYR